MKNTKTALFILCYTLGLALLAAIGYFSADYRLKADTHRFEVSDHFRSDVAYVDLPAMNLTMYTSSPNAAGRVRINLSLEVDKKYASKLEDYAPRITDRLIDYTRQLDFDEIKRPSATSWLRQRYLEISNDASTPVPIIDIIFKKFIVI